MSKIKGNGLLLQQAKSYAPIDSGTGCKFGDWLANALYIGTAGNVVLVLDDDSTLTLTSLLAGMWHSMPPFKRINGTSTTAANIVVGQTFHT